MYGAVALIVSATMTRFQRLRRRPTSAPLHQVRLLRCPVCVRAVDAEQLWGRPSSQSSHSGPDLTAVPGDTPVRVFALEIDIVHGGGSARPRTNAVLFPRCYREAHCLGDLGEVAVRPTVPEQLRVRRFRITRRALGLDSRPIAGIGCGEQGGQKCAASSAS